MSEKDKILCPDDCANFDETKLREFGYLGRCSVTGIGIKKAEKKFCINFKGKIPEIEVVQID